MVSLLRRTYKTRISCAGINIEVPTFFSMMLQRYLEEKAVVAFHLSTALVASSVLPVQPSLRRIPSMLQDLTVESYDHLQQD